MSDYTYATHARRRCWHEFAPDGFCTKCGWGSNEAIHAREITILKEQLMTAQRLLHHACTQPREFYLGQEAACIALGPDWYAEAQDLLIELEAEVSGYEYR
jgi:hypothetical protein